MTMQRFRPTPICVVQPRPPERGGNAGLGGEGGSGGAPANGGTIYLLGSQQFLDAARFFAVAIDGGHGGRGGLGGKSGRRGRGGDGGTTSRACGGRTYPDAADGDPAPSRRGTRGKSNQSEGTDGVVEPHRLDFPAASA